jgi:hypothetical protein
VRSLQNANQSNENLDTLSPFVRKLDAQVNGCGLGRTRNTLTVHTPRAAQSAHSNTGARKMSNYLKREYLNGIYERPAADEPRQTWVGSKSQYLISKYASGEYTIGTGNLDDTLIAVVRFDGTAYSPANNNRELSAAELERMQNLLNEFESKVV